MDSRALSALAQEMERSRALPDGVGIVVICVDMRDGNIGYVANLPGTAHPYTIFHDVLQHLLRRNTN